MGQVKIYDRRYYIDATLDSDTKTLELRLQTVDGPLLSPRERMILTDAVNSIATGEVTQTSTDPARTLEFKVTDVKNNNEAALLVRKVVHNASGHFLDGGISLVFDPNESSLVKSITLSSESDGKESGA